MKNIDDKDLLKKIIDDNRDLLNDQEPNVGHFDRFEERLHRSTTKKSIFKQADFWMSIAAVLLVFIVVNAVWEKNNQDPIKETTVAKKSLGTVSPKLNEVEVYYTSSINSSLEQLKEFKKEGIVDTEEHKLLQKELAEFEKTYKNLQKDLAKNLNDQRVIEAMIHHYQTKLHLINLILDQLNEAKEKKEKKATTTNKQI